VARLIKDSSHNPVMKEILEKGEIKRIIPRAGGGLTGEVHLLKYQGKKFILRRCNTLEKAKQYVTIYKKFKQYGFLPKLLGRYGKDVLFEFIPGRYVRKNDSLTVYAQLGRMAAQINQYSATYNYKKVFYKQLQEIITGKYELDIKVLDRRRRNKVDIKPKRVFTANESKRIKSAFTSLEKKCKPQTAIDANDYGKTNFIIGKNHKVYFVDIEAIRPKIKGFGIAKAMMQLIKKENQQQAFMKGYEEILPTTFLTEAYKDFLDLSFLMQKINYMSKIYQKSEYEMPVKKLRKIVTKYSK